jgi:hypothetical protein
MKTKIYNSYLEFLNREQQEENGVSKEFAEKHPDYEKENSTNKACSGCFGCFDCSGCFGCSDCFGCSRCSGLKNSKPVASEKKIVVPIIENIHQKVYEVASNPKALDMSTFHTCEKTHCRAGWVITLAGKEGSGLEAFFDPVVAAMKIYDASSTLPKVSPVRFFEDNEAALADMKRMAELEKAQSVPEVK